MSSSAGSNDLFPVPVATLEYREIAQSLAAAALAAAKAAAPAAEEKEKRAEVELSAAEYAERIRKERADAVREAEQRLRQEYEAKLQAAKAPVGAAITAFDAQRSEYFARVEAEVVQLALAIAAKILHREAQIDPMLVATLVRMAIEKMGEGSQVTVRVNPANAAKWTQYFAAQAAALRVTVSGDAALNGQDCVLETELGSANFGLDTQLKEVEQGFFDLMALRPANR
jgi:flagellar assembly protein FliH